MLILLLVVHLDADLHVGGPLLDEGASNFVILILLEKRRALKLILDRLLLFEEIYFLFGF